ncbi:MAG: hypothetical protein AAFP13_03270 [Pseudomonadota bacterium]
MTGGGAFFQRRMARRGLLWCPAGGAGPLEEIHRQSLLDYGLALMIALGSEDVTVAVPPPARAQAAEAVRAGRDLGVAVHVVEADPGLGPALRAAAPRLGGCPLLLAPLGLFLHLARGEDIARQDVRQRGATLFASGASGSLSSPRITADALGVVREVLAGPRDGAEAPALAGLGLHLLDARAMDFAGWLEPGLSEAAAEAALLRLYASERSLRLGTLPAGAAWHRLGGGDAPAAARRFVAQRREAGDGLFGLPEAASFERGLIDVRTMQEARHLHAGTPLGEAVERRLNQGAPEPADPGAFSSRALSSG